MLHIISSIWWFFFHLKTLLVILTIIILKQFDTEKLVSKHVYIEANNKTYKYKISI